MKKLKRHSKDDNQHRMMFDLEILASIYAYDRANHRIPAESVGFRRHLIPLLASFEIQSPATGASTFYLMFVWADGTLKDFWEANSDMVSKKIHLPWIAEQFSQLSGTLRCIHNDLDRLKSERTWSNLYGRHGDIKPDNFLFFNLRDGQRLLVFSDLGLGRLHHEWSRSHQNPADIARVSQTQLFGFVAPRN
jgi:serine/threonine protein kinase